jgi:hypothetical protein
MFALAEKEPQAFGEPHATDQVTWVFSEVPAAAFVNVAAAVSVAEAFIARDLGGGAMNKTPFGCIGDVGGWLTELPQPARPAIRPPTIRRTTLRSVISDSVS